MVTADMENKILSVIDEAVHHFKEGDPSARAKNAYDVLFKAVAKRSHISPEVKEKQAVMAHALLKRIINIVKAYSALLAENRGGGSDVEVEVRYVLKKLSQLNATANVLEGEREWIKEDVGVAPREGSCVWSSGLIFIMVLTPLLLGLVKAGCEDVRQLVGECLQQSHIALLEELLI